MSQESATIEGLLGFGNDRVGADGEHYRSVNMEMGRTGMAANRRLTQVSYRNDYFDNSLQRPDKIIDIVSGFGSDVLDVGSTNSNKPFVFAVDAAGRIWGSKDGVSDWRLMLYPEKEDAGVDFDPFNTESASLQTDAKGYLLVQTARRFDRWKGDSTASTTNSSVTNGDTDQTLELNSGSGDPTGSIIVFPDAAGNSFDPATTDMYFYKVESASNTSGDTWDVTLSAPLDVASKSDQYCKVLTDYITGYGGFQISNRTGSGWGGGNNIPMANYEDVTMIGRGNKLDTYNAVSDSYASPALTFPDSMVIENILIANEGILIVGNYDGRGLVAIWDNSAQNWLVPWIRYEDEIISATELGGQGLIRTERSFYLTDGYSSELVKTDFLEQDIWPDTSAALQNMLSLNDGVMMGLESNGYKAKAKSGLYQYNSSSKLFNYLRHPDGGVKDARIDALNRDYHSDTIFTAFADGSGQGLYKLQKNTAPDYASMTTADLGGGAVVKYAEELHLDIGVYDAAYTAGDIGFTLVCKVADSDRQMYKQSAIKTNMSQNDEIVVDETVQPEAQIGDEVEILNGSNAGQTRNITNIANGGTDTATYTLDRDLDNLGSQGDEISITPFQLVGKQTYSGEKEVPYIFFDIDQDIEARRFKVKIELIDAQQPLEIRPSYFIYDTHSNVS